MQETACLLLSGLIQTNPLFQGVGHHCGPNPPCTPFLSGYRALGSGTKADAIPQRSEILKEDLRKEDGFISWIINRVF